MSCRPTGDMMKKIWIIMFLVLMLTGCKIQQDIKLDTIVDIPLHPTEETAETESTPPPTEETVQTEAPTEKGQSGSSVQKPSTGGKKSSGGSTKETKPKETKPKETKPATVPTTEAATEAPTEPPTEAPTQPKPYDPSGYIPGSRDRGVADAVNAQRTASGLAPLTMDTRLCGIASVRAREAARVWSQNRPDGSGWITVLSEYGYGCSAAAQNLYFGTGSAESIVNKWMSSESHQKNLLMENASVIGVGSYTDDDGLTYVAAIIVQ